MSDRDETGGRDTCTEITSEASSDLLRRFTAMVARMKGGAPLIRRIQSDIREKNETALCTAFLSEDLRAIKFVRQENELGRHISESVLQLSAIDAVGLASSDKLGVGLLMGSEEVIMTLIMASEEDWNCWYSALRVLCARGGGEKEEDWESSSEESEVQEDVPILSGELDEQNEKLQQILNTFSCTVDALRGALREEQRGRKQAELENVRLRKLLLVREETVTDLSLLIQSLLKKQREFVLDDNVTLETDLNSPESRRDSVETINSHRASKSSSTASTPSTSFGVLETLETQLRQLETRKQQLEDMLESVSGS